MYQQCFICRGFSWDVSTFRPLGDVELCLPCYVDVLEVRERRGVDRAHELAGGVMGERRAGEWSHSYTGPERRAATIPGNSPSPFQLRQLELFEPRERYR